MKTEKAAVRQAAGQIKHRMILMVLVAVLATAPGTAWAGINVWTSRGPERAIIGALAIDPQNPTTIYAGTFRSGVFKSTDGAGSWFRSALTSTTVRTLVVDPQTLSTVYAGTEGAGVFRSTDGRGAGVWRTPA